MQMVWTGGEVGMKEIIIAYDENTKASHVMGDWVGELVRCKDCKAWKQYDGCPNLGECEMYPEYNKMGDWFCNFGELKEGR